MSIQINIYKKNCKLNKINNIISISIMVFKKVVKCFLNNFLLFMTKIYAKINQKLFKQKKCHIKKQQVTRKIYKIKFLSKASNFSQKNNKQITTKILRNLLTIGLKNLMK